MADLAVAPQELRARRGLWRALRIAARHPLRFLGALFRRVQPDGMLTVAAAMAYYFFFSLFPFLLFLLALASVLPIRGLEDWVLFWMYALAVFLLLGAELNALLEQTAKEGRVPERDATPPRRPEEGVRPGERIRA